MRFAVGHRKHIGYTIILSFCTVRKGRLLEIPIVIENIRVPVMLLVASAIDGTDPSIHAVHTELFGS